jgi:hypothetical protein
MKALQYCVVLALACETVFVSAAKADWNPGDPAKWVQLPDLSFTGMDVYDTRWPQTSTTGNIFKILADDWECKSVDPVTDIHIWGSWLNNRLPTIGTGGPNPAAVTFKLSIHEDIPVGPGVPYSRPGQQVWSRVMPATSVRLYAPSPQFPNPVNEYFYDPNINQIIGADNQVWQYNFTNLLDPFIQQGTAAAPKIYWLDVQAVTPDPEAIFGWKTAIPPHRLDDAVFADTEGFGGPLMAPGWRDLHYPPGHPYQGQSFDLSFVITTIPEPASLTLLIMAALSLGIGCRRRDA